MRDIGGANNVFGDQINQTGDNAIGKISTIGATSAEVAARLRGVPPRPDPRTVLMLSASPVDTDPLRLDEEHRGISRAIRAAPHRDQIKLELHSAPRYGDLPPLLHQYRPAVVHFAGHGDARGIALLEPDGRARLVPPAALEKLFSLVGDRLDCVVLNACLSSAQATAIARHVRCVVGMSNAVQDVVAIQFAVGFYSALASGESVAKAFEFGRNLPALGGLYHEGPQLFSANGVAAQVRITR